MNAAAEDAPADDIDEPAPARGSRAPGCVARLAIVVVAGAALVVAIGATVDWLTDDPAPRARQELNVGPADAYQRGDVSDTGRHIYVTRLEVGTFIALYDVSPKQQELRSGCRVAYEETASLGGKEQLAGFEGGFVEDCEGSRTVWRADGEFAFGAGYGNLDRFQTSVNDAGELIIVTESRTCTRSIGVPGIPPFRAQQCEGNQ